MAKAKGGIISENPAGSTVFLTEQEWLSTRDHVRMLTHLRKIGFRENDIRDRLNSSGYSVTMLAEITKIVPACMPYSLIREVFGNPFRAYYFDTDWLRWNNGQLPSMAQSIYDREAWYELPYFCDAVEEAGCSDPMITEHLRGMEDCGNCLGAGKLLLTTSFQGLETCDECGGTGKQQAFHCRGCRVLAMFLPTL